MRIIFQGLLKLLEKKVPWFLAQKQLRNSALKFRTIADYTYDWESWLAPDGKYNYISPSCERITGYSSEKFLENQNFFYDIICPDERKKVQDEFQLHMTSQETTCTTEFRILRPDGETRWIEHVCQPIYSHDGMFLGRRASNRDISKRKSLELQLEHKVAELEEALDRIKTLSGLIPICSNCKRIRDDKGYWNLLETYIQDHSEAKFSHGLCPKCSDEIYGEQDWYKDWKKGNKAIDINNSAQDLTCPIAKTCKH